MASLPFSSPPVTAAVARPELPAFCRTRPLRARSASAAAAVRRLERLQGVSLAFHVLTLLLLVSRWLG